MGKAAENIFFTDSKSTDIRVYLQDDDNVLPFPNQKRTNKQPETPIIDLNEHTQNGIVIIYTTEGGTSTEDFLQQRVTKASSGKDDPPMDWQEKYIDKLDRDIDEVKNTITASEERISRMIESSLTEIRDRDNQRQQDMNQIRSSIDSINDRVKNLTIAAVAAIASMVVAFIVATLIK